MELILSSAFSKWILAMILAVVAFVAPIHTLIIAIGILLSADFVTGVARAIKRGDKVSSRKMRRSIYKALGYQLAVLSGFAFELLMPGVLPFAKLIAAAVGLVEFKSILENVTAMTGVSFKDVIEKASQSREDK
jgi:hypothetical protein